MIFPRLSADYVARVLHMLSCLQLLIMHDCILFECFVCIMHVALSVRTCVQLLMMHPHQSSTAERSGSTSPSLSRTHSGSFSGGEETSATHSQSHHSPHEVLHMLLCLPHISILPQCPYFTSLKRTRELTFRAEGTTCSRIQSA
jgi:hypothetical protein